MVCSRSSCSFAAELLTLVFYHSALAESAAQLFRRGLLYTPRTPASCNRFWVRTGVFAPDPCKSWRLGIMRSSVISPYSEFSPIGDRGSD